VEALCGSRTEKAPARSRITYLARCTEGISKTGISKTRASQKMLMIDLTPYKSDIRNICREIRLQRLDLIGSATRDDFSDNSDIDVLITFEGDENLFDRYFSLKEKLEEIFKRKVDVIEERAVKNPFFRKTVNRDRIKLYGA
jgi:predicted nucleotidyltransferase